MRRELIEACNECKIVDIENDKDALLNLMFFFEKIESKTVSYYQNVIRIMLPLIKLYSSHEFENIPCHTIYGNTLKKGYINLLKEAFSFAGSENSEKEFRLGVSLIREYGHEITYWFLEELLQSARMNSMNKLNYEFSNEVIFALIDVCSASVTEKQKLKFKYIDIPLIGNILYTAIQSYVATHYENEILSIKSPKNIHSTVLREYQLSYGNPTLYIQLLNEDSPLEISYLLGVYRNSIAINMKRSVPECGARISFSPTKLEIVLCSVEKSNHKMQMPYNYEIYDDILYDEFEKQILNILFGKTDVCETGSLREQYKPGKFELLYLYGENIHDLKRPRQISFTNEFLVTIDLAKKNALVKKNPDYVSIPKDFFGPKIDSIQAIIGKNGSGKSSIFDIILDSNIFGNSSFRKELGDYFLLYRIENSLFYSTNGGEYQIEHEEGINIQKHMLQGDVRVCRISNIFDMYDYNFGDSSVRQVIDLTTQHLMMNPTVEKEFEKKRIRNYQLSFQKNLKKGTVDNFGNKVVGVNMEAFSSGERARISIFSRLLFLFYINKEMNGELKRPDRAPNYLLLFDEIDIYFHPAWQRRIILDICEFLTAIDELCDGKAFQHVFILLSSNSPFYMSDLPCESIHKIQEQPYEALRQENTFGQNIYALLKDEFFMDEGIIGAFAQKKINWALSLVGEFEHINGVIRAKENHDILQEEVEMIEYLIHILGEPLYQKILEELLSRKRRTDYVSNKSDT